MDEPVAEQTSTNEAVSPAPVPKPRNGLAIASLVTGILALLTGFIFIGIALGVAAILLGAVGIRKPGGKGMSIAGIVTGALGLLMGLIVGVIALLAIFASGATLSQISSEIDSYAEVPTGANEYYSVARTSDKLLADARKSIDESAIVREELVITDLEKDRHRYSCSESTSRYVNSLRVWLADIEKGRDAIRRESSRLLDGGWVEINGDEGGGERRMYIGPSGFSLAMTVWADRNGNEGLTFTVDSVCVPNPKDKPSTWGK